jgi:hypothetical protein
MVVVQRLKVKMGNTKYGGVKTIRQELLINHSFPPIIVIK